MDQTIACTLTAAAFRDRAAELSALAAGALRHRRPLPGGERLTFAGDPATERDLRAAVAAERKCCAFLDLHLRREGGHVILDVTGPDAAQPLIAELFA